MRTEPTASPRCRRSRSPAQDIIEVAFEKSVDGGRASPMLGSRLHDFGFRGCTCVEQASQR